MAELNIDGEPVFVDVANDPQFPILYSQLIESTDTNMEQKPSTISENTDSTPRRRIQEKLQISNDQAEATNACIKIEKRRLKCPECKRFTCETEEKMLRHIRRVHRGENPFQCYLCEYSTYNKAVFEEHVRVHQGIKPFKCSFCPYKSASKKNAKKHELRHGKDNPLRCPDCEYIGKNSQAFHSHRSKVHGIENTRKKISKAHGPYSCNVCKREFPDSKKKNNHSKSLRKCPECTYATCSKTVFDAHLEFDHGIKKSVKRELQNLFTCSICPWSSSNKPRILLHLIHHPNQSVDEDVIDISVLRRCGIME